MCLEPDQAGAQSHPQCQVHPIPLYESDNYIYYVDGLQSLLCNGCCCDLGPEFFSYCPSFHCRFMTRSLKQVMLIMLQNLRI